MTAGVAFFFMIQLASVWWFIQTLIVIPFFVIYFICYAQFVMNPPATLMGVGPTMIVVAFAAFVMTRTTYRTDLENYIKN